jgi:hypothetical protein
MIYKIYLVITTFYSFITSCIEIFFLKNKNIYNVINKNGYKEIKLIEPLNLKFDLEQVVQINNYMDKILLSRNQISEILDKLFNQSNLKKILYDFTGFKFNIGFVLAYITKNIPAKDQSRKIYANHWHKDLPFSKNTLKIIIPLKKINYEDGGIEIKLSENKIYKMVSDIDEVLVFNPNLFYHKAGNPDKARMQIMLQLNPSAKWSFNNDLVQLQRKQEPKFPGIAYILKKKTLL